MLVDKNSFETTQVKNTLHFFNDLCDEKASSVSITTWSNGDGFDIFYQSTVQDWIMPVSWDAWKNIKRTVKRHMSDE